MNAAKTRTGIAFFDTPFGGVYTGRCWTVSGPSGTGKSAIGLQFLATGIQQGERCLMLSIQRAVDTVLWASSHGPAMEQAIESGQLTVLEYGDFLPGRDTDQAPPLPPAGFLDLQQIVHQNDIKRVTLDTVLPWAMSPNPGKLVERIFSLVRAFERLKCTTLLILPRPVSPPAVQLKQALETIVPIAVELSLTLENGQRSWQTSKYLGEPTLPPPVSYTILPGCGAQAGNEPRAKPLLPARNASRVRYAPAVFGPESHAARAPDRNARYGMTIGR